MTSNHSPGSRSLAADRPVVTSATGRSHCLRMGPRSAGVAGRHGWSEPPVLAALGLGGSRLDHPAAAQPAVSPLIRAAQRYSSPRDVNLTRGEFDGHLHDAAQAETRSGSRVRTKGSDPLEITPPRWPPSRRVACRPGSATTRCSTGSACTMAAGKVTALIGPSGCGKSTFLRILNRMHELVPSAALAGEVRLDGRDIYDDRVAADRGPSPDRHGLPEAEPVPGDDRLRQRRRRPEADRHARPHAMPRTRSSRNA